jgi:hypothetical protein
MGIVPVVRADHARSVRVAKTVVMTLGIVLIALGIAAVGALLLFLALAGGGRDWAGAEATFAVLVVASAWTVSAGGVAVWLSRRTSGRTIWLAGLPCLALGAVPAAVVAVDLLFLLPR